MTLQRSEQAQNALDWKWPVDTGSYDRCVELRPYEKEALALVIEELDADYKRFGRHALPDLKRLIAPLYDVFDHLKTAASNRGRVRNELLREMHSRQTTYWSWSYSQWSEIINGASSARLWSTFQLKQGRRNIVAVAYLLCGYNDLGSLRDVRFKGLAEGVFGREHLDAACELVLGELTAWGWNALRREKDLPRVLSRVLLANQSPHLQDLTTETLQDIYKDLMPPHLQPSLILTSRVLAALGFVSDPLPNKDKSAYFQSLRDSFAEECPHEWEQWCLRWRDTSTAGVRTRKGTYGALIQAGRWLARAHPGIVSPDQWTREVAADYVAAVDRLTVGEWSDARKLPQDRIGNRSGPGTNQAI